MQLLTVSAAAIPASRLRVPAEPVAAALVRRHAEAVRAATVSTSTSTKEEMERGRDRFVKRAVWAAGRLWLLTDRGTLSSVAPGERERRAEPTPQPAAEICAAGAVPVILGSDGRLSRLENGSWRAMRRLSLEGEPVLAISCTGRRVVVVTRRHVATIEDGRPRYATLSRPLTGPIVRTAPFDAGKVLLLGTDQGEWGGGLERIETATGETKEVAGLGGPINGVGPEPGRPRCLVATVGLVHFLPSGQVVEVCGDKVRRLYYKPYTMEANWPADPPKLPFETVPFYALAQTRGGLWIAGGDGLYSITAGRPIAFRKMPAFEQVDGVDISFAVPGLAMVRTDVDSRVSLGGGAPLLVARRSKTCGNGALLTQDQPLIAADLLLDICRSSSNRVGCKGFVRCRCREHGRLRGRHVPPHDGASRGDPSKVHDAFRRRGGVGCNERRGVGRPTSRQDVS